MNAPAPAPALPWLAPTLAQARTLDARSHALLLHGAIGDGLFDCAHRIVERWLCEAGDPRERPCGACESCRMLAAGAHPDLHRLLPEALRQQLGLASAEAGDAADAAEGGGSAKGKRKPSRQIRIEEVRAAIDWAATTSSRGGAKVILMHPAEAMNLQAASALLKTLEEPPAGVRLLLASAAPARRGLIRAVSRSTSHSPEGDCGTRSPGARSVSAIPAHSGQFARAAAMRSRRWASVPMATGWMRPVRA